MISVHNKAIVKARLFGFEMTPGAGITITDFLDHVAALPIDESPPVGSSLLAYTEKKDSHYVGCVITTKDKRKFLEVVNKDGEVRLNARDVTPGSHLAEFNFFALYPQTGRGVYLHYSDSCGLQRFGGALQRRYMEFRDLRKEEAMLVASKVGEPNKQKIRALFKGKLQISYSFRTEDFDSIAAEFDRLQGVRFSLTSFDSDESDFRQLAKSATRRTKSYSFAKAAGSLMAGLLPVIKAIWEKPDVADGSLSVADAEGVLHTISLAKNRTNFGEYDLDDLTGRLGEFNPRKFGSNAFSEELIKVLKSHQTHFETPVA